MLRHSASWTRRPTVLMMVVLLMVAAAAPVVVAPASAVPVASAARTAGAAVLPAPFTGSVDDFYRVPDPLPPGVRGEVIRMQAIDAGGPDGLADHVPLGRRRRPGPCSHRGDHHPQCVASRRRMAAGGVCPRDDGGERRVRTQPWTVPAR